MYQTKKQRDAETERQRQREWEAHRAADRARWEKGETAANALKVAGYPSAKGFYESVLLDHDDALRLLGASARVPS